MEEARDSGMAYLTKAWCPIGSKEPCWAGEGFGKLGMVAEETIKEVGRGPSMQNSVSCGKHLRFYFKSNKRSLSKV